MPTRFGSLVLGALLALAGCATRGDAIDSAEACVPVAARGLRPVAADRAERFLGKVDEDTARCRGGQRAVTGRSVPWLDWQNYWATADGDSRAPVSAPGHLGANGRGIDGALLDLEYQRIELIKFNLFDSSGTYADYVKGRDGVGGPALKTWPQMRLPKGHPLYDAVGGEQPQVCGGELIRFRTLSGICNDLKNPLMGSASMPFARNVQFEVDLPRARHRRAHPQPARRPAGPAPAGSAGDQPPALHACPGGPGPVPRGARPAWQRCRRPLRLQEGAVLQRAGRLLDPVHDARLVLAPAGGPERARDDGRRLPGGDGGHARVSPGRSRRPVARRRERRPREVHPRRQALPDPRPPDHAEHRDGVVGRLADLRLRRDLAPAREARARRCRQAAAHAGRPARRRRRAPRLPAAARGLRPDEPAVGRPGGDRLPGQLDDRDELLSHGVRPRAQPVRRGLPCAGRRHAGRRLRAAQPRPPGPGHPLSRGDRRRALRGGAPGRLRRDRQDPHHRVDAPAPLRRAALPGHERQLDGAVPRQGARPGGARADHRQQLRQVERREEGHAVVLRLRLRAGHLRPRQPRVRRRRDLRRLRSGQDRPVEPGQPRSRQWRGQPLRLAVQLPGGVRHRLPPARPRPRSHRVPAVGG